MKLDVPEILSVRCDIRPYGKGFVHVVDSPYHAVTDRDGRFQIDHLPTGTYVITVWHEATGQLSKDAGPTEVHIAVQPHHLEYRVRWKDESR